MHLFFIDDSGTISPASKVTQNYFVLGGPVIPEDEWHNLEKEFSDICNKFRVLGEIKWRFFGQKAGREDSDNTISHLCQAERDFLRKTLLNALTSRESIKIIVTAIHLPTIYGSLPTKKPEDIHAFAYEYLMGAFQAHLQNLSQLIGSKINGIIISDHRNPMQDTAHRNLHMQILKTKNNTPLNYPNLIEGLFLAPSHHSIGIQFADLISGAVFRYYEHQDDRWYSDLHKFLWKSSTDLPSKGFLKTNLREK